MCLVSRCFDAAELGFVAALQVKQVSSIIHDGDDYAPIVALCFCFGRLSDTLGVFQGKHRFACHDYLPDSDREDLLAYIVHAAHAGDIRAFWRLRVTGLCPGSVVIDKWLGLLVVNVEALDQRYLRHRPGVAPVLRRLSRPCLPLWAG